MEHAISGESNNPGLHCHFDVPSLVHFLSMQISSDLHSSSNLQIPRKFEINHWHLHRNNRKKCLLILAYLVDLEEDQSFVHYS